MAPRRPQNPIGPPATLATRTQPRLPLLSASNEQSHSNQINSKPIQSCPSLSLPLSNQKEATIEEQDSSINTQFQANLLRKSSTNDEQNHHDQCQLITATHPSRNEKFPPTSPCNNNHILLSSVQDDSIRQGPANQSHSLKPNTTDRIGHRHNQNDKSTRLISSLTNIFCHTNAMTSRQLVALVALAIILLTNVIRTSNCYNLDTQKALFKRGPKGSYFGYSLAQHAVFDAQNLNSTYRSFVIVGAPRNEARSLGSVYRPGGIYKCDFEQSDQCYQLDVDPGASLNHIAQNEANSKSFIINTNQNSPLSSNSIEPTSQFLASSSDPIVQYDNQWLGVSVKSQGPNGFAMACAHRQVLKSVDYRWGQGICYSLTRNLTYHKTWQPCLNRPVNYAQEQYGYCQVGTSCDISDTSDIVLGSPGPYTWRGTLFANSISFSARDDRTWYMAPVQDGESKVDFYSYLGMSVLTGKFFNKQQHFISGAPRSKEMGQVLVMTKQQSTGASGSGSSHQDSNLKTVQIIDGEQVGSSFGYSMVKLDFNGDGQQDLAISAPFYFSKHQGGAVYLYANNGKQFSQILGPSGKLTGKRDSRFGFALANCGDLNHDKFEDLAVGAPYEEKGGVVYIYSGSATGLKPVPSQEIRASSINTNLQTFGYSLSGGLDMDLNGYPDLAVGSYADDSIYILRARPIIEITTYIEGNLTRIDPNKTTCDGEKNQLPCFKFKTCFELDPQALGEYSDTMKLKYKIEAETFTGKKFSRVKFQESESSDAQHIVEKDIILDNYYRGMKLKRCNVQRVLIRDRSDIQSPIQFKLTYYLEQPSQSTTTSTNSNTGSSSYSSSLSSLSINMIQSSSSSSSLRSTSTNKQTQLSNQWNPVDSSAPSASALPAPFPILKQEEALRVFSARFLKDCGSNDICESNMSIDGEIAGPKESLGFNEIGNLWDRQLNLTIRVVNNHEPAYESRLYVSHPANVVYAGTKVHKAAAIVDCLPIENQQIRCELGNPMPRGSTKLQMMFQTQGQSGTFDFQLMVNTTSQNSPDAKTQIELSKTILKKVEFQYPSVRQQPDIPVSDPPLWLILLSILLGLVLFATVFHCLYINGFFERRNKGAHYSQTETEDRIR